MVEMNSFAKQKRVTDVENKCIHGYQGGKGGEMNWEIRTEMYTLLCRK